MDQKLLLRIKGLVLILKGYITLDNIIVQLLKRNCRKQKFQFWGGNFSINMSLLSFSDNALQDLVHQTLKLYSLRSVKVHIV